MRPQCAMHLAAASSRIASATGPSRMVLRALTGFLLHSNQARSGHEIIAVRAVCSLQANRRHFCLLAMLAGVFSLKIAIKRRSSHWQFLRCMTVFALQGTQKSVTTARIPVRLMPSIISDAVE
jgi:hypothetical protein